MHMRDLLVRGMFAGCLASVVAFGVATAIGEPPIDAAITGRARSIASSATIPNPSPIDGTTTTADRSIAPWIGLT